jgi:hypothetical protein
LQCCHLSKKKKTDHHSRYSKLCMTKVMYIDDQFLAQSVERFIVSSHMTRGKFSIIFREKKKEPKRDCQSCAHSFWYVSFDLLF